MFSIQIFLVSTNTTISYFSSYFLIATVICFVFLEVNATISCFQHNCYFLIATVICFIFLEVNATISCFRQNDGGTNSLLCPLQPFFPIIRHQLQRLFYNFLLGKLSKNVTLSTLGNPPPPPLNGSKADICCLITDKSA